MIDFLPESFNMPRNKNQLKNAAARDPRARGTSTSQTPAVMEQSRTETADEQMVSLVGLAPVEGVFLRQWGSKGSGEGEFDVPTGVCVSGTKCFL